eukprot:gene19460-26123_t
MAYSRPRLQLLPLIILSLLSYAPKALSSQDATPGPTVKEMASAHFSAHGSVKPPIAAFIKAVGLASYEVDAPPQQLAPTGACRSTGVDGRPLRRRVVLMAMANDLALNRTVPFFIESLRKISVPDVVAFTNFVPHVPSLGAEIASRVEKFQALDNQKYSDAFTDVVVFSNFVPHVLSLGADVASTIEKIQNDAGQVMIQKVPAFNIGVTYFKATPAVLRCAHSWMTEMYEVVEHRPGAWDQEYFGKVMNHCTRANNLTLHGLSPRMFNSGCYMKGYCGCNYSDETMISHPGTFVELVKMPNGSTVCPAELMKDWVMMHFPCSGSTETKSKKMRNILDSEWERGDGMGGS